MQAITFTNTRIHCDLCHHEFRGNVPDWHNKPCVACGEGVLINDTDMALWESMHGLANALNEAFKDVEGSGQTFTVTVNSAMNQPPNA